MLVPFLRSNSVVAPLNADTIVESFDRFDNAPALVLHGRRGYLVRGRRQRCRVRVFLWKPGLMTEDIRRG